MKIEDLRQIRQHLLECSPIQSNTSDEWHNNHRESLRIIREAINKKEEREARRELKAALGYSRVGRDAMRRG